jgi:phosphatidylglycerol:prolipoprotein diacylglycerol transferase
MLGFPPGEGQSGGNLLPCLIHCEDFFKRGIMAPVLFTIGDLKIYSSVFFLVLAILVGLIVGRIESRRLGLSGRRFFLYGITVIPVVLGMGALNGWIFEILLWNILQNYEIAGSVGLVSYGAVLGALGWGYVLTKARKQSVPERLDLISEILPLILGIYRIGCFFNGCCHGREIGEFFAGGLLGGSENAMPRYPTQIMLMLMNFGIFAWLWHRRKRKSFEGELALSFLLLYSMGRFIIDAFRDLPQVLGPLSLHQLSEVAILLITIGIFIHVRRRALPSKK